MLKREWGAQTNGKLLHLFIPSKTAAWVPEFAVEDRPLSRTAAFVVDFSEGPALGQNTDDIYMREATGDWDFRISDLVKNHDGTDI